MARVLSSADRRALFATLDAHAAAQRYNAIRARAMYALALSSGLRLTELLRLDLPDVIETPDTKARRPRIKKVSYLGPDKAVRKGRGGKPAVGAFTVGRRARAALGAYLEELRRRGWVNGWTGPLWITVKGRACAGHHRLRPTTVHIEWTRWQAVAGIGPYRFHDLRHTAITRFADASGYDVYAVAAFARHRTIETSLIYVQRNPKRLADLADDL